MVGGTVDSTVASNTRRPGFKSSHRQLLFNSYFVSTIIRKDETKEKESGNGQFKIDSRKILF